MFNHACFFLTTSPSNFRGISQSVDLLQKNEPLPTSSKADTQPGESEEDGPNHGIENLKVKEYPQQRFVCHKSKSIKLDKSCVDGRDRTQPGLNS